MANLSPARAKFFIMIKFKLGTYVTSQFSFALQPSQTITTRLLSELVFYTTTLPIRSMSKRTHRTCTVTICRWVMTRPA